MASDTRNVKLGVCKIFFGGIDLGYTQGGVEVQVTTETHKVEVDQFGKAPVAESIMGRSVMAKVPLAETTIENMLNIMPGARLFHTGGVRATGSFTFSANVANNDVITVNGVVFTFRTSPSALTDIQVGASQAASIANAVARLNASTNPRVALATYTAAAGAINVAYKELGVEGNAFTLAVTGTALGVSGANLASGANPTAKKVTVTDSVSYDLLSNAKELRFHPQQLADSDQSEDFVIPKAATAGALTFAYKVDQERIYNVEFSGYPDPVSRVLFQVGTDSAVTAA